MSSPETPPHLFHFRVSHYNEKVRWALDFKGIPHTRQTLIPGFHVPTIRRLTGQNKVPVLKLNGRVIAGSSHIIGELEHLHPNAPLFPADPKQRERALAIQAYFDDEVAPTLRRLFWSTYVDNTATAARMATAGFANGTRLFWQTVFPVMRPIFRKNMGLYPAKIAESRDKLSSYFDRLDAEIGPSGYLVGDAFSVADLTAAAVMTAIIRPPEFPYPLPEPWPPALVEMRASMASHRAFAWVLDIYKRHRGTSNEI